MFTNNTCINGYYYLTTLLLLDLLIRFIKCALEEKEAEKVLIVADGWDELSKSDQQEGSFLYI